MTCKEAAELIYTYAETKPTTEAQEKFQEHIQKCPECLTFIQQVGKKINNEYDVSCGQIPPKLLEEFSLFMRNNTQDSD